MNDAVLGHLERRHCFRARLSARATVRSRERRAACVRRIDDLSLGGAHLIGKPPVGVGGAVTTVIRLDSRRRIAPRGRVLRLTGGGTGFVVAFTNVSPRAEDLIHDCIVRSLEADEVPAVLLIEPNRETRQALTRMLTQVGCRVLAVATPVEAIDQLTAHADCIRAAMVSQRLTQTTGVEFVTFLRDAFPDIRRVLTADGGESRTASDVRSSGLVHDALTAPWLRSDVTRAVGARREERAP